MGRNTNIRKNNGLNCSTSPWSIELHVYDDGHISIWCINAKGWSSISCMQDSMKILLFSCVVFSYLHASINSQDGVWKKHHAHTCSHGNEGGQVLSLRVSELISRIISRDVSSDLAFQILPSSAEAIHSLELFFWVFPASFQKEDANDELSYIEFMHDKGSHFFSHGWSDRESFQADGIFSR